MADGVWRTIKGRHVYIKNGQDMQNAIRKRKKDIEDERTALQEKTYSNKLAYNDRVKADRMMQDWYDIPMDKKKYIAVNDKIDDNKNRGKYITNEGKYSTDTKDAIIINNPTFDNDISKAQSKSGLSYYDIEAHKAVMYPNNSYYTDIDNKSAELRKNASEVLGNNKYATYRSYNFRDAQIDDKGKEHILYYAKQGLEGISKSDSDRATRMQKLYDETEKYYKKHPVQVNEKDFKRIDRPMMQDALNDLYLQGVRSKDADQELTRWKALSKGNSNSAKAYKDMVEGLNSMSAREQIDTLNNTRMYEANNYLAKMQKYSGSDRVHTNIYNLNKRDDMSYPDVYEEGGWLREGKFGVNWSAMGTMSPKDTYKYSSRMRDAADFAKGLQVARDNTRSDFKAMDMSQAIRMFQQQGYSLETAKKMANNYLRKRK